MKENVIFKLTQALVRLVGLVVILLPLIALFFIPAVLQALRLLATACSYEDYKDKLYSKACLEVFYSPVRNTLRALIPKRA